MFNRESMSDGSRGKNRLGLANAVIVFALSVFTTVSLLTYNTDISWSGHAVLSLICLGFAIWLVTTGPILSGRIHRGRSTDVFKVHRRLAVWFTIFVVAVFLYSLAIESQPGEPLLHSPHGWFGLLIAVLAVIQIVPSLVVKNRKGIKRAHMVLGFLLPILVILQVAYGVYIAAIMQIDPIVLAHSLTGAVAALSLVWVMIELSHLNEKGIRRATLASYVAVIFTVLGCWVLGGINYLTSYRPNVRAGILSSNEPWAHQVIMETKEHIFLFLPIITILVTISILAYGQGGYLLESSKARSIVLILAAFALVLMILMFVMGFIISDVGNIGAGG